MILQKNIPGTSMRYTIYSNGKIIDKKESKELIPKLTANGKLVVELWYENKLFVKSIAKIVARLWLGQHKDKEYLIYKDGNYKNCSQSNLLWATKREFKNYKIQKSIPTGTNNRGKSLSVTDMHTGKSIKYESPRVASEALGIPATKIRKALRGKVEKINNFTFQYA